MNKIIYIILAVCTVMLGYRYVNMCEKLFPLLMESERNRGITVATMEGVRVYVCREGHEGAPNEDIVLSGGGEITWCGISLKEHKGALIISYKRQQTVIEPRDMTGGNEEGKQIWHKIIFNGEIGLIRHKYGLCTEPPCGAASMSSYAFLKMIARDYIEDHFLTDMFLLLQLIALIGGIILLLYMPIREQIYAIYAILTAHCVKGDWECFETEDGECLCWKTQRWSRLNRLMGANIRFVLIKRNGHELWISSAYDDAWLALLWNIKNAKLETTRPWMEKLTPRMIPASAGILDKIKFAWIARHQM